MSERWPDGGITAYYAQRHNLDCWTVQHSTEYDERCLLMTSDQIAAIMCARIAERAYRDGFEAGLVAQKHFPKDIRAFGYLSSCPEA